MGILHVLRLGTVALGGTLIVALSFLSSTLFAESNDAGVVDSEPEVTGEEGVSSSATMLSPREKADYILALIAGDLTPEILPESLFDLNLALGGDDEYFSEFLDISFLSRKRQVKARRKPYLYSKESEPLWMARQKFFALPSARRAALLVAHENKRRAAARQRDVEQEVQKRTAALLDRAEKLSQFLERELDASLDPSDYFHLQLLTPSGSLLDPRRRARLLGRATTDKVNGVAGSETLAAAEERVDKMLATYLALPSAERAELFSAHREKQAAIAASLSEEEESEVAAAVAASKRAEEAAEAQKKALEDMRDAESESARILAEEHAKLLGVREQQALYRNTLETVRAGTTEHRERALKWSRRVSEVVMSSNDVAGNKAYEELVAMLTVERTRLKQALVKLSASTSLVPSTVISGAEFPSHVDETSLDELRTEISTVDLFLQKLETEVRWENATVLRDGVVSLNRDRLRLLPHLSSTRRSELRGFGREGVAQVRRELSEISLELQYSAHALPRTARRLREDLTARPLDTLFNFLKLLALTFGFRAWRKHSKSWFTTARQNWLNRRPQTRFSIGVATAIWYTTRVRVPLEWLVFFWFAGRFLPYSDVLLELALLWRIVAWCLIGTFAIRLVDATAARLPASDDSSALRYRSLRFVGVAITGLGLLLSLTNSLVGEGAIYSWVWRTCWVVSAPIGLLLVRWWKPIIFVRAARHPTPNRFLRWALAHKKGVMSVVSTAVAGGILLLEGIFHWALRQASELAVTRRLLAHLFRREVEKHASAAVDDALYVPLDDAMRAKFGAKISEDILIESVEEDTVARMRTLVRKDNNLVIAVVGERGLGKTRFLERVAVPAGEESIVRVDCQPGGFRAFIAIMARQLDLPQTASEEEVVAALKHAPPTAIIVDDAHRLIKPLIGGLTDVDQLVAFAQRAGPTTSWLVAIGGPAWQYLRRARGGRAIFDEVVLLRPWDEVQIREFTRLQCAAAQIVPRFDKLAVPRQMYDTQYSEAERTERDYSRILWDYADGNPSVAAHFWRESLTMRAGECYVRLFKTPAIVGLEGLPGSIHFVLRAVIQMELALEQDIIRCTDLHSADVSDALRVARSRKYVEKVGKYVRVTPFWFRAVTRFLRRQHLLVS